MRKWMTGLAICTCMVACNNESDSGKTTTSDSTVKKTDSIMNNTLTDAQKAEGWQLLFDGQTTAGWHKYGNEPVGSARKIADGALYLDSSSKANGKIVGGGDLVTDSEYENFHLKLEWKIEPGGNSGIMFNVVEDTVKYKHPYETGPEMQVLDNQLHNDSRFPKHRAGDLYDLVSSTKETVKPAGEWNVAEIRLLNGKLDLFLNGENNVSIMMWDDNWKKLVAGSKFKQWKDFATFKKGKICLQDHDNQVWYRNIMIRKL